MLRQKNNSTFSAKNFLKSFSLKDLILISLSLAWTIFNVYFLPFVVWTLGISRPWFIIKGLTPYKDFTWIRTPLDIYLLSFWYRIFGVSGESYQSFVFVLLLLLMSIAFLTLKVLLPHKYTLPFILFNIFAFLLFINTEEGEIFIALFNMLIVLFALLFFRTKEKKWLFLAGISGGFVYITKQNSSPVNLAVFSALIADSISTKEQLKALIKKVCIFLIGVFAPILILTSFFIYKNAFSDYFYYTVIFVFKNYLPSAPDLTHGDGGLLAIAFLAIFIPFILFWKEVKLKTAEVVLITVLFFTSLLALLPSFLSYRAFPVFGISMIIAAYDLSLIRGKMARKVKVISILSFILFFAFTWSFIKSYISFVQQNNIMKGQYITDYGENEYKVAKWINQNTKKNEKILNYDTEMVYFLSDKLPINKYIEPFPFILMPYNVTAKVFINNPPRIIIYDNSLTYARKDFDKWPFLKFMRDKYEKVKTFGETIEIYEYR